jgi:Spy/CpxP family protein refolding chaperone
MKKINLFKFIFTALAVTFMFSTVKAQDETLPAPDTLTRKEAQKQRPKMLDVLGLTQDQMQQFRRINMNKKPAMREAQQRLRAANRSLDEAIYADNVDETEIQIRIKELQAAQIEVIKIRSLTELAIRRILTAEQLTKFRGISRQFAETSDKRRNENRPMNAPNRRFNNRRRNAPPVN